MAAEAAGHSVGVREYQPTQRTVHAPIQRADFCKVARLRSCTLSCMSTSPVEMQRRCHKRGFYET